MTRTKLLSEPPVKLEAQSQAQSPDTIKEARVSSPHVYWSDRMALVFWLFCFALLLAMNLVEAVHRFILFLMARSPSP